MIGNFLSGILAFTNWVWGWPMLIWLIGGGVVLSVKLGFIQFRKLPFILKHTIGKSMGEKGKDGKFSGWQAVTGALASTLGAGSIVGAALAIGYGGPGGVFWMWVTGLIACVIKYSEVVVAMKYRIRVNGAWKGGPQVYLPAATGMKWLGVLFAVICIITKFFGSSAQVAAVVDTFSIFHISRTVITVTLTVIAGVIVMLGMGGLLAFTEKCVPIMSTLYFGAGILVILLNIQNLPGAVASIFRYAFTGRAAVGGFSGASLAMCIRWGLARGIYSNDAGNGATTIMHSVAEVNHPVQQGMWGVFEVFCSTLVICSVTCLAILCTGVWQQDIIPATYTITAFTQTLGVAGKVIVSISTLLFCFTTAVAGIMVGSEQIGSLVGSKAGTASKLLYMVLLVAGGMFGMKTMISYTDFFAFLMIATNTVGVYKCANDIVALTKEYFSDPEKWEAEKWPHWVELEKQD